MFRPPRIHPAAAACQARQNVVRPYDVAGNVWEWTTTPWVADHTTTDDAPIHACCTPGTENIGEQDRRAIKGGSHLCAPSYCHRYRPAARQGHAVRSTTSHLGFRCVLPA